MPSSARKPAVFAFSGRSGDRPLRHWEHISPLDKRHFISVTYYSTKTQKHKGEHNAFTTAFSRIGHHSAIIPNHSKSRHSEECLPFHAIWNNPNQFKSNFYHSHSIVPVGFGVRSHRTRFTPLTSWVMRSTMWAMRPKSSSATSAVTASTVLTARITTGQS